MKYSLAFKPQPLPAANNAEGLIERLAELYRKSATTAEGNAAEARERGDLSAAEANAVWAAAMRMAAKMADKALRNYRGNFSDGQ